MGRSTHVDEWLRMLPAKKHHHEPRSSRVSYSRTLRDLQEPETQTTPWKNMMLYAVVGLVLFVMARRAWVDAEESPALPVNPSEAAMFPVWSVGVDLKNPDEVTSGKIALQAVTKTEMSTDPVLATREARTGALTLFASVGKGAYNYTKLLWGGGPQLAVAEWSAKMPWLERVSYSATSLERVHESEVVAVMHPSVLRINRGWRAALARILASQPRATVVAGVLLPDGNRMDMLARYCPDSTGNLVPADPSIKKTAVAVCRDPGERTPDIAFAFYSTWELVKAGTKVPVVWCPDMLGIKV